MHLLGVLRCGVPCPRHELSMTRKRLKPNTDLMVKIEYVLTPDSDRRLSRAIAILLELARRVAAMPQGSTDTGKQEPLRQNSIEDIPTDGDETSHFREG